MEAINIENKKEMMTIPRLRFQEFRLAWEEKRLDMIFSISNGYAFSSQDAQEDGCKWIKIADVGINEMKTNAFSYLPMEYRKKYKEFVLREGDIVIALTRPFLNKKLKIASINKEFNGALLNQRVGKLISNHAIKFIYYLLQRSSIIYRIENRIAGTDPPNLSPYEIGLLKAFIPTLPEQQKIASFLSAVDKKIQQLNRKKELLEQYKKGVMQKIFSQEIRFKDEKGKDYPDWETNTLGKLVDIKSGISPSIYKFTDGGLYPFLKVEELNNCEKYQTESRFYSNSTKNLIEKDSIIFPKRGVAILNNKVRINSKPVLMDSNLMSIRPIRDALKIEYLYYIIYTEKLYKIADTSTIPQINNKHIQPYKIQLPSTPEQQKIASFLSSIDNKLSALIKQLNQTQQFKKGLLQQMFV